MSHLKHKGWIILMFVMALFLVACGNGQGSSSSSEASSSSDGKTVVTMYVPGDKPESYDRVMKEANKELQTKYPDLEMQLNFIPWGDYAQKYSVMLTAGDDYDLAFLPNGGDYAANAQKGVYADLTDLLQSEAKEAYDDVLPSYWQALTLNDKIYAFPVNANAFASAMATFNGDYVDELGLDISKVNSYKDLEPLLSAFHEKHPDITPMAIGQGFHANINGYEFVVGNNFPFVVDASGKDTEVKNVYDTDQMKDVLNTLHDYYNKGYIPKDAATSTTQYLVSDPTWFVRQETQGPFDYGDQALNNISGGQKIVSRPLSDVNYRTQSQAQVALWAVSQTSKHKKEAVQVLNAINTDPKLLNTLIWGSEGVEWNFTDEKNGKIETTDKYKAVFLGAWMTGDNEKAYTLESVKPEMIEARKKAIKESKNSALLGFMPDLTKFNTQISNITNVMTKYIDLLNTGTADPDDTIPKMDDELKKAGYDEVRDELQKQYDAFLESKK